jgi:hypothetical protein
VRAGEAAADGGDEMIMRILKSTVLILSVMSGAAWAEPARFETPEAAVAAMVAALEAGNREAVLGIFGPENEDILSTGNREEDREVWGTFLKGLRTFSRIEVEAADGNVATLFAGREMWPFPVQLVRTEGMWSFDAESTREEIRMRRIGRNELAVIAIMRRAGEIQAAYRRTDHDGDGVMEFAASILSSPGNRDGLYWPLEPGAPPSPFGETIARAAFTGYSEGGKDYEPEPFEGYYFRILHGQGDAAQGGAYSYMVAGNMVAGHAVIACPAVYGDSGIMSFMVGENGILYEADLGEDTLAKCRDIVAFDPGEGWVTVD